MIPSIQPGQTQQPYGQQFQAGGFPQQQPQAQTMQQYLQSQGQQQQYQAPPQQQPAPFQAPQQRPQPTPVEQMLNQLGVEMSMNPAALTPEKAAMALNMLNQTVQAGQINPQRPFVDAWGKRLEKEARKGIPQQMQTGYPPQDQFNMQQPQQGQQPGGYGQPQQQQYIQDPNTGMMMDPATGAMFDPVTGQQVDPNQFNQGGAPKKSGLGWGAWAGITAGVAAVGTAIWWGLSGKKAEGDAAATEGAESKKDAKTDNSEKVTYSAAAKKYAKEFGALIPSGKDVAAKPEESLKTVETKFENGKLIPGSVPNKGKEAVKDAIQTAYIDPLKDKVTEYGEIETKGEEEKTAFENQVKALNADAALKVGAAIEKVSASGTKPTPKPTPDPAPGKDKPKPKPSAKDTSAPAPGKRTSKPSGKAKSTPAAASAPGRGKAQGNGKTASTATTKSGTGKRKTN